MKKRHVAVLAPAITLASVAGLAFEGGVRKVPAREVAVVPDTVSQQMQALIAN